MDCLFPGSKLTSQESPGVGCDGRKLIVHEIVYQPSGQGRNETVRPVFSLPFDELGRSHAGGWPYAPSVISTIDARNIDDNLSLLPGAIVIIGGSYQASGDLHATPLGNRTPGAIVHANAIRAVMMGEMVTEHKSWPLKLILISTAALIGALAYVTGLLARGWARAPVGHILQLLTSLVGIVVSVIIIFALSFGWAREELATSGTAIGTLTPALAVAFEGTAGVLQDTKRFVHELVHSLVSRTHK